MDPLETTLGILIALVLFAVAAYFAWTQWATLQALDAKIAPDQRRYLFQQCSRRLLGSVVLLLLAAMLFGSVFLDYDPLRMSPEEVPQVDLEAAKPALRFLTFYFVMMLVLIGLILTLAVFDFWATARHSVRQQKQLFLEHQEALAAELEEYRQRQSDNTNGSYYER